MTIIRKASSNPKVVSSTQENPKVRSLRQPSTISEMGDTDFGSLGEEVDGYFVSYNSSKNKFELVTSDTILERSIEDDDLPDEFITQLESELNLGTIAAEDIDGGTF